MLYVFRTSRNIALLDDIVLYADTAVCQDDRAHSSDPDSLGLLERVSRPGNGLAS
jgi:hypothetical protein